MYWLQWSAIFSSLVILAHASPVQNADEASINGKPTVTTMIIHGNPMTFTIVGKASPTVNAYADSKLARDSKTGLPQCNEEFWTAPTDEHASAAGPTFWEFAKNLSMTSENRLSGQSALEIYALERLGWEEDMQCGKEGHRGCSKLPPCDHVRSVVNNDPLAREILLSMEAANNNYKDQCSLLLKNNPMDKDHAGKRKNLGGQCQHVADQMQIPPVEHYLSMCKAGYHWPTQNEKIKMSYRHTIQKGPDALCGHMREELDEAEKIVGNSSLAINCYMCNGKSKVGQALREIQRCYVRDYHGNMQNNYNWRQACSWYREVDDAFKKGLAAEKGCVRKERGIKPDKGAHNY